MVFVETLELTFNKKNKPRVGDGNLPLPAIPFLVIRKHKKNKPRVGDGNLRLGHDVEKAFKIKKISPE